MGYGQHTKGTRHYYPETPQVGRRTKAEVLDGLCDYVRAWCTGHNEVTRLTHSGATVVRLIATDILWLSPSGHMLQVYNGGWHTPTTVTHINAALQRHGFGRLTVWNDARRKRHHGHTTMDGRPERQDGRGELKGTGGMIANVGPVRPALSLRAQIWFETTLQIRKESGGKAYHLTSDSLRGGENTLTG